MALLYLACLPIAASTFRVMPARQCDVLCLSCFIAYKLLHCLQDGTLSIQMFLLVTNQETAGKHHDMPVFSLLECTWRYQCRTHMVAKG